ncbi:response regulator [Spirosoma koreense]
MNKPTANGLILLVDDNQDATLIMSRMLQVNGYRVHTCHSGQEGLEATEQLRPAVVVLDLAMPGLDGYTVCQQIRAQPWGSSIRLIALSGYGSPTDQTLTRQSGFDAHLVKPVDWTSLTRLLDQWLAGTA